MGDAIRVLHVDDDPDLAEVTAAMLHRVNDAIEADPVPTARAALERLNGGSYDCIVSDYDMAGMTGIDLLNAVRDDHDEIPFILFTGKGSEEVAADALSAGATDYLQKDGGESQYQVLANRIEHAVDRFRAHQETAEANRHRRQMLDRITDGYARLDDDLTILDVNEATAAFVGTTRDDLLGRNYRDLADDDGPRTVLEAYETVIETGVAQILEARSAVATGRWVEDRIFPAEDGGLYVYFRDITESKQRERALEAERDRLSAIFEAVPEPLVHAEFVDSEPIIRRVNAAFEAVFGHDAEDIVGASINDLIVSDARLDEAVALDRRSIDDDRIGAEVWRETATGERLFRFSAAAIVRDAGYEEWISTYIDITDQRRREEVLEGHRTNLERLHEAANRLYAAESTDECYDITMEVGTSILGFDWCTLAAPAEESPEMFEIVAISEGTPLAVGDQPFRVDEGLAGEVYRTKEPSLVGDVRESSAAEPTDAVIRSGLTVPVGDWGIFQAIATESHAFDEHDRHHAELLVASMLTTIDRIEQQRELERQRDRLDEFASVASHDLRNPLAIADGRIELARDEVESEHLEEAAAALERMDELIEDLLALAREGEMVGEFEEFSLDTVVAEGWQTISSATSTVIVDDAPTIFGDRRRVRQLLENLFRNAVDHGGPAVTVTLGSLEGGFYVADDGPGIPPADREVIFTTGYSTAEGGTGFGLSIVKRIVDAHGWRITAEASEDGGARFEITGVEVSS